MKRFTKSAVIVELDDLADNRQKRCNFNPQDGRSQLWPPGVDSKTKTLVDRAVDYGYWLALRNVARDIESGKLGTGDAP